MKAMKQEAGTGRRPAWLIDWREEWCGITAEMQWDNRLHCAFRCKKLEFYFKCDGKLLGG